MESAAVPADQPAKAPAVSASVSKPVFITWMTLALMTTSSVASLRSAPTMAVYGLACVFLYIVPAIVFLIPQALVAAELASGWSGGVFRWVSEGISPRWGLLAVWCQFAMTIFYYPTLLGFVASTLAYVFNPDLADNGVYTGIVIVVVFWLGVFMSARGGTGGIAKLASSGLVVGTLIPGVILVVLGIVFLGQGNSSAAPMNASHLVPEWTGIASLVLIVNNFLAYSGMEMNAVHVSSLRKPGSEFPRAMFVACGLVLLIFILPSLAISWVVPAQQLSLTAGVMQAFSMFFEHFGLTALVPIVALALVCASAGGMLTWLGGPSKGLVLIAKREGYLPPYFQQQNEHDVAVHILVAQGVVTTVIALMYALIPSVSSAYWILSVMTTQVYLVVYLLMFVAAVRLRQNQPNVERGYKAPALKMLCITGFVASAAAVVIGFVPPSQFGDSSPVSYAFIILAGTFLIGLLPPWLFLRFRKPDWKQTEGEAPEAAPPAVEAEAPVAAPEPVVAAAASAPEPPLESKPVSDGHSWHRWAIAGGVVVLLVIGLFTYNSEKKDQQAQQKAIELTQKFQKAGLTVPADQNQLVKTLGTDGGAICDDPASALGKATLNAQLTNGASFVGQRPLIVPRELVQGELLVMQTYCPDKVTDFQNKINDLKFDNTIKP